MLRPGLPPLWRAEHRAGPSMTPCADKQQNARHAPGLHATTDEPDSCPKPGWEAIEGLARGFLASVKKLFLCGEGVNY